MVELRVREPVSDERLWEIETAVGDSLNGPWRFIAELLDEVRRLQGVVAALLEPYSPPDSVLTAHGRAELTRAGYYQRRTQQDAVVANTVTALLQEVSMAPLSGVDLELVLDAFDRLARGENLLIITSHPSAWTDRTETAGYALWQNKHDPRVLSTDGGTTWFYTEKTPDPDADMRDILIGGGAGVGAVLGCRICSWREGFGVIELPLLNERAQVHRAACPQNS